KFGSFRFRFRASSIRCGASSTASRFTSRSARRSSVADPHGSLDQPNPSRRHDTQGDRSQVALVPDDPDRFHLGRGISQLIIVVVWSMLLLIALAGTAVYVVSNTDWGRERVRRYAEDFLNAHVHGQAKIGRLSGNLLVGVTVHDFSIVDTLGKPFIAV